MEIPRDRTVTGGTGTLACAVRPYKNCYFGSSPVPPCDCIFLPGYGIYALTMTIRQCEEQDFEAVWLIINDGAQAYKDAIPPDRWKEPYMSRDELRHEMHDGVQFWDFEEDGELVGVMGIQPVKDVTLIRHAYVRTARQKTGIGAQLLAHLRTLTSRPVMIGTWADASWAIRFYEKHGFRLVGPEEKNRLLKSYWTIPDRQSDTSVVLIDRNLSPGV